jgi:hypothetical protein
MIQVSSQIATFLHYLYLLFENCMHIEKLTNFEGSVMFKKMKNWRIDGSRLRKKKTI